MRINVPAIERELIMEISTSPSLGLRIERKCWQMESGFSQQLSSALVLSSQQFNKTLHYF